MKKTVFFYEVLIFCILFLGQASFVMAKTFKCTNGSFDQKIGENGNECILYVRSETGISWAGCHGEAWQCYNQANDEGYSVGSEPAIGAIVVFKKTGPYSLAGHVGIVKSISANNFIIRESNVVATHIIGERTISKNDITIRGYIYCDEDPQTETEANTTAYANSGQLAWIPLGVDCKDAMKWIDIETGNVVADKSSQSVSGDVVCESYGIYPTCGINNSQY